jgi:molybdenum cofactor guanylyltransferase
MMIGVVLCGGKSSRMGTDKGLLTERNKAWSELAIEKLSSLSLNSVVSINSSQLNTYSSLFSSDQLIVDKDWNIKGPLLGLLSVHDQFVNDDLLVLGCDLPKMELNVLQSLVSEYKQFPHFDTYIFNNGIHSEPLCGIYTSNCFKKISNAAREGKLRSFRMMDVLDMLNSKYLPLREEWKSSFQNINSPADLN